MSATIQTEAMKKYTYKTTVYRCKKCNNLITLEQDTTESIDLMCKCGSTKFIKELI